MSALSEQLIKADPIAAGLDISSHIWSNLTQSISQGGLEAALQGPELTGPLLNFIRAEVCRSILEAETSVIRKVLHGQQSLMFSELLPKLPQHVRVPVITTNYDRLIELAAEMAGFQVDTKTQGFYHAQFSQTAGAYAYCSEVKIFKKTIRKVESKCVSLYKPHGSLDWVRVDGKPIRSAFASIGISPLIIAPGQNKFQDGYEQPFDLHRDLGNKAIDNASRLLIIGYGFNDTHLETHIRPRIQAGTPTVVLTKELTPPAQELLTKAKGAIVLLEDQETDIGTIIHIDGYRIKLNGEALWNVRGFLRGVLAA